ncbi:MAG: hypothetical protein Q7T20_19815 [Saprospiraceae bacterium]|nr:hypothetical protein [Saprospiraceae bacterium]
MRTFFRQRKMQEQNTTPPKPFTPAQKPGFFEKLTHWELWPAAALYAPLSPIWAWYSLKARSFWWFTPSNPTIPFGGYEGETKTDVYKQMPEGVYPRTILVKPLEDFKAVKMRMLEAGFQYPFIVKPDVGRKGLLFRKIDNEAQLLEYHGYCPMDYLIQDLVDLPMELGVFYVRHPTQQKGQITGIILREALEVWGDGKTTLRKLIEQHPHAGKRAEEMCRKHEDKLDWVPEEGERYVLSFAINRSRGARLHNLSHEIDAELTDFFDKISLHSGAFFWGRYDVKCTSMADLKAGKNFSILEYNGAGASPSHIYHCGMSLWQAYAEILRHWKLLYAVSSYNNAHGHPYWPFWKGLNYLRAVNRHLDLLDQYD